MVVLAVLLEDTNRLGLELSHQSAVVSRAAQIRVGADKADDPTKGIGPKKIATIWKEMEIESIGELLYACNENRLLLYKGFGEKTQNNVRDTIEFYLKSQGSYLYEEAETFALATDKKLKERFTADKFELTGEFRRQLEIINKLEWVTTAALNELKVFFEQEDFKIEKEDDSRIIFKGDQNINLIFRIKNIL